MGVVDLSKENFEKVRVINNTFYEDIKGKRKIAEAVPSKMQEQKDGTLTDVAKHKHLVCGVDLTIQIARKLVQAGKAAPIYAPGKKPKEI